MRSGEENSSICRKNSECTEEEATNMIREGLTDAFRREKERKAERSRVPLEDREAAINENFPDVQGSNLITEMTEVDLMALRLKAYYSEKRRMKEMFKMVQEQIAEYHELLEYSNKMESRLGQLKNRARFLKDECKQKTLMVSCLEKEMVDLKLNLANEKSSSQRMLNELAKVKSENQILTRTLSMQSLGHASTKSARRGSAKAARHSSLRMASSNISFDTDEFRKSHFDASSTDPFNLVRSQPNMCRRISPLPMNGKLMEPSTEEDKRPSPMSDFMNLSVSWMNNCNWGSKASFSSEQDLPPVNKRDFYSITPSCCVEKSDATAITARLSSSATIASALNVSTSCEYKNADWNEARPTNASINPLLRQLRDLESEKSL